MKLDAKVIERVALIDCLDLQGEPALSAHRCVGCGARFFDRRNACARCGGCAFDGVTLARRGTVRSFTVVYRATAGVQVPYVSVVVELDDGKSVKANLVGSATSPAAVMRGLRVELTVWTVGVDPDGTKAVTFGFRPVSTVDAASGANA